MKLSHFAKIVPVNETTYAIFNTLIFEVIFINSDELMNIMNFRLSNKEIYVYRKAGILVNDVLDDQAAFCQLKNAYLTASKAVHILYLSVVNSCNLACQYCYVEKKGDESNIEYMSIETADIAIEKFSNYIKKTGIKDAKIIFFGGEPLLNYQVIVYAINKIRTQNVGIKLAIVTNGVLLSKEIINYFVDNQVEIGISLDGPKDINDSQRVYKGSSQRSVYESVIDKIAYLHEVNADFCISVTLTMQSLRNRCRITKWLKSININKVFFNLFHFSKCENDEWKQYYESVGSYITDFYRCTQNLHIRNERLCRELDVCTRKVFKFGECASIGANQITIKPNGDICVCPGYTKSNNYILGNICNLEFNNLLSSDEFSFWVNRSPIFNDECINCEALFICGGGCSMQAESLFDNRLSIDRGFCCYIKHILNWYLKEEFNEFC